jgi:acyl-coenzyme A thioesterase PaaI-like protein
VRYQPSDDGQGVTAVFPCDPVFDGYAGHLHGGVVCSLLDGAMVHCLFQRGRIGYTAELSVRFRGTVATGTRALVRGRLERSRGRMHVVTAELSQDGVVKATARAKFLEHRHSEPRLANLSRTPTASPRPTPWAGAVPANHRPPRCRTPGAS